MPPSAQTQHLTIVPLDREENVYVAGYAGSGFPNVPPATPGADPTHNGYIDVFIAKFNSTLSTLMVYTFIGGSGDDQGGRLAIDGSGNIYITGTTTSSNFPTTSGAYDRSHNGGYDSFITKFDSTLSNLLASSYLGGNAHDGGSTLSLDGSGNVYLAGATTQPTSFPVTLGAYDGNYNGGTHDGFIAKLDSTLSNLLACTYLGGNGDDTAYSLILHGSENVYVTGYAQDNFPTTIGAYDETFNGGEGDVFVSKFDNTLSTLLASTYIGGGSYDAGLSITLDGNSNVYVAGMAGNGYPLPPHGEAYDESFNGVQDAFVSKLDPTLSTLSASTLIGGPGYDRALSLTLDGEGHVYVTGSASSGFPITPGAYDETFNGGSAYWKDAFVSKFDSTLSNCLASTYLGGSGDDLGVSIILDKVGNVYVAGTASFGFPFTIGAYDESHNGNYDVFISKFDRCLSYYDSDEDEIGDNCDNCSTEYNPDQDDLDGDDSGDVCDDDVDGDGVLNVSDNCPLISNSDQEDNDSDNHGDVCDNDDDNDSVVDTDDNCKFVANADQSDIDGDGLGDVCDADPDGDDVIGNDNCPFVPNPLQEDNDLDGYGDACDDDDDNDGILDINDNCPSIANVDQTNTDSDEYGDVCDIDDDGDGVNDVDDNCPLTWNADQNNNDSDGLGDACDPDDDNDGIMDGNDNCPLVANVAQSDNENDGLGDVCDPDDDNDGVEDQLDNCPLDANVNQSNNDGDILGDVCDPDDDNDGVIDGNDNCPFTANPGQQDSDGDGLGNVCDDDRDGDGILNADDNCPDNPNADQSDIDQDGLGDVCDDDIDGDGVLNQDDNCPHLANANQADNEYDGLGDVCDSDDDNDSVIDVNDNCPLIANLNRSDYDNDGIGDACDSDIDGDGVPNDNDICPGTPFGEIVDPLTGCSIDQLCPCDSPYGQSIPWKNHGKYVSCVAKTSESFVKANLISKEQKDLIVSEAAKSVCGVKK